MVVIGFIVLIVGAMLFPVFASEGSGQRRIPCLSNMKQIAMGSLMYSADWGDRLPRAASWADDQFPYTKSLSTFTCPTIKPRFREYGHAFRSAMDRKPFADLAKPERVVLQFDSKDLNWNANGDFHLLPAEGRYPGGIDMFSFADGHVRAFTPESLLRGLSLD